MNHGNSPETPRIKGHELPEQLTGMAYYRSGVRIAGVAVKVNGVMYAMGAPNRHHDVIRYIFYRGVQPLVQDQGFMDTNGKFLTRKQAMLLAKLTGQFKRGPDGYQGPELFSEDLW